VQSFVVHKEELNKRLDAWSYRPAYRQVVEDLKDAKWSIYNLIEICKTIFCGPFGTAIKSSAYVKKGVPFIRITNIKSGYLDKGDLVYITPEDSERLKSTQLNAGDLVISQRGTIGNVAQIPEEFSICNISANTIGVKVSEKVNTKYILWFLISKFGKIQFENIVSGHIQNKITTDDVKNIKIPLPPRQIQDKIADIKDEAYKKQREMLDESKKILNSIESYLLKELSIKVPSYEEKKKFIVRFDDFKNNRYDVHYHQPKYEKIEDVITGSKYGIKSLGEIVNFSSTQINLADAPEKKFKYIEIEHVDGKTGQITGYLEINGEDAPSRARMLLHTGDLLISSLQGSPGSIAIVPMELDNSIGTTGFIIINKNEKINNIFLWGLLRTSIYQSLITREATGAIMAAVTQLQLAKIKVPLPPLSIQNQIANEINSRHKEAEKLRIEAERVIKEAKEKVEKMILLGEDE
jgi:restriction endonuclease S subunit